MLAEIIEPIATKRGLLPSGQLIELSDDLAANLSGKVRPALLPGGLTIDDLKAELGTDPDWEIIKGDLRLLFGYAESIYTTRQVRAGQIPDGWVGIFECAGCGPVFLEPGGKVQILACPWCFNREKGLPIPRPDSSVVSQERIDLA